MKGIGIALVVVVFAFGAPLLYRVISEPEYQKSPFPGVVSQEKLLQEVKDLPVQWEPDPKKVEKGKEIYMAMCMTCHGREGDGFSVTPEGLKTDLGDPIYARDFTGKYHRQGKVVFKYASSFGGEFASDEDLKKIIKEGLPGTPMPGFPDLTDEELDAIVEYIKSLNPRWKYYEPVKKEYPSPPEDLYSSRRVEKGRELFQKVCIACHGNQEEGGNPIMQTLAWYAYDEEGNLIKKQGVPMLQMVRSRDFRKEPLRRGRPTEVFRTIREGIAGTTMNPATWKDYSDEDIWNLVSYVYYLQKLGKESPAQ